MPIKTSKVDTIDKSAAISKSKLKPNPTLDTSMREIKFRAQGNYGNWHYFTLDELMLGLYGNMKALNGYKNACEYTGLKDKNGLQEVYEGDVVDNNGEIKGNIYEMDKGETDLVIEGLGTSAWSKTEKAGLERGLKYAK